MNNFCNRQAILVVSVLLLFSGCRKENFAENFNGNYTGTATERSLPDMSIVKSFNNCKVTITELDRKKIRLTITSDPANPASQFFIESLVQDANHFSDSRGGRRIATTSYNGTLQSGQLTFEIRRVWYSGTEYEFKFQGTRD